MFRFLGTIVSRAWPLFIAGWLLALAITYWKTPVWEQVAQDKEFAFLPADAPSRMSEEMMAKAFPDDKNGSNIVLVLRRSENNGQNLPRDLKFIEDTLEPGLRKIAEDEGGLASEILPSDDPLFSDESTRPVEAKKRSIIARIRTPNAPGSGVLLISDDQQMLLVAIELTTEFLAQVNWSIITKIEELIDRLRREQQLPPGMDVLMTGSAVIGRDRTWAQMKGVRSTEWITVVLVIALLLLIYRAPLLAVIPLATVYLTIKISVNLLGILADTGFLTLFQGIQIYITILAYGAGVDYCLFLTARYKEELDNGRSPQEAVSNSVKDVGAALVASALTVICGIGMMVFAQFEKFREAGIAISLSLFLVLCATLTFSPALLRLAGRWAFWPHMPGDREVPGGLQRGWEWMGQLLARRPGTIWLLTVGIMAPFVIAAIVLNNRLSYDLIGELPATSPSVIGTRVLQDHFPAGLMGPVKTLLVCPQVDFSDRKGRELVANLTNRLEERKKDLGLGDIRSLTAPLGVSHNSKEAMSKLNTNLPAGATTEAAENAALEHYVTDLGERAKVGTRIDLILAQSPFAHRSMRDLDRIQQVIKETLPPKIREESQLYCAGLTASVRDLEKVIQADRTTIEVLVLSSVLIILVLLLHEIIVPVYLLLSVLFSYFTTLGLTFALFWLLDPQGFMGLSWKVAIFLFTILIAVGEDYNIFLMARVKEEERRHGPTRGIITALTRTGPIISSCGIIMAGSFASLMSGTLAEMRQLGFALAFGILLDTFVVRPILVPAFLILLRTGRLNPANWHTSRSTAHVIEDRAHVFHAQ